MTDDYTMLGISSMLHLLVDGLCMCSLFLMSSLTDYSVIFNALIIYNVLAFLTQPFTGMMADKMPHRHWLSATHSSMSGEASRRLSLQATTCAHWAYSCRRELSD